MKCLSIIFLLFLSMICCSQDSISRNEKLISELEPSFPGGAKALREFVNKNLKYQKNRCVEGITFVSFIVNKDGSLTDIKIVKGLCEEGDRNAIEVFKKMPKWIPGKLNNGVVPMRMIYPIKFKF